MKSAHRSPITSSDRFVRKRSSRVRPRMISRRPSPSTSESGVSAAITSSSPLVMAKVRAACTRKESAGRIVHQSCSTESTYDCVDL
jgi:hypothetical protein